MNNSFVGRDRSADKCEECGPPRGEGGPHIARTAGATAYPSLVSVTELLSVDQLRARQIRLCKTSLRCTSFVYQKIFELDLSFVRIFVRTCLNVLGLIIARNHPKYCKPGSKS
jgi:hypothetical protein